MKHDRTFNPRYGEAVEVAPDVRRITAENPSPFTFYGTNSYLLGSSDLIVVDPGPALPDHIEAILQAASGARIEAILVTHTHMDHSPGAKLLKERTGAPILGCGPHLPARPLFDNEVNALDASSDKAYRPDRMLKDGEVFSAGGIDFEAIATPGHTANHLCFALPQAGMLLSADHVMAWATSIVAPPDGSMRDYFSSLDKLLARKESFYLPGHGGVLQNALHYVEELKAHRLQREASILEQMDQHARTIPEIVAALYADVDPKLHGAAGLSVLAHLEDLAARGIVSASPDVALDAQYRLNAAGQS